MDKNEIIATMKSHFTEEELSGGQIRIIGSAAMVMHGIMDCANDIDIRVLTTPILRFLAERFGAKVHVAPAGRYAFECKPFDVVYTPELMSFYGPLPAGTFPECAMLEELPCDRPHDLLAFYTYAVKWWNNGKYSQRLHTITTYINNLQQKV